MGKQGTSIPQLLKDFNQGVDKAYRNFLQRQPLNLKDWSDVAIQNLGKSITFYASK